jgi:DNA-binding response OmpR family regulator
VRACVAFSSTSDVSVHNATSTQEALVAFRAHRLDLVVLHLNLPNSNALELLRRLILEDKEHASSSSMHADPVYVVDALKEGPYWAKARRSTN